MAAIVPVLLLLMFLWAGGIKAIITIFLLVAIYWVQEQYERTTNAALVVAGIAIATTGC